MFTFIGKWIRFIELRVAVCDSFFIYFIFEVFEVFFVKFVFILRVMGLFGRI